MENKVNSKTFWSVVGIMMTIIGWILISLSSMNEIKVDIGTIQTDISWIKKAMNKQNNISLK